ncbi:flavin reductase like domain-containing protein [Lipomyces japonicus]|uniref:flavin reductase like domain-containing protein n=1 Tax=Lipomyces japonicus TaxID=56871 RepID=UPI0034D01DE8
MSLIAAFKAVMARHPQAIAVITAAYQGRASAATVSSVTSLSVAGPDPPLLSFNLRIPSATSELVHASGRFSVNFLAGIDGADQLASEFARAGSAVDHLPLAPHPYRTPMLNRAPCPVKSASKANTDVTTTTVLSFSQPAAFARLDCAVHASFLVRDHEIWVGEVERIDADHHEGGGDTYTTRGTGASPGLVYFRRKFHKLPH